MRFSHEHLTILYWTACMGLRTVIVVMKLATLLLSMLITAQAHAGSATAVSASDAHTAIAQGAYVIDVRPAQQFAGGHLPQAMALPENAAVLPLNELAALLSQAGIDSSRTMLVVGGAGDANAQALWQRLADVTSGRVLWLVGGVQEWQLTGRALTADIPQRSPVPQFLTPFNITPAGVRMAGSKVRSITLLEQDLRSRVTAGL
jgi:3-mercaptopyruvate sulfurtransferase SseA